MVKKKTRKNKSIEKVVPIIIIWILYIIWIIKFSSITPTIYNFIIHLLFLLIVVFIFRKDLLSNLKELKHTRKKKISRIFLYFFNN